MYRVEFTAKAAREVRKLPRPIKKRVVEAAEALAAEPRPHGSRKLVGEENAWRIRVGNYRVIYEVLDDLLLITVVRAGHRREVYR